MKVKFVPQNVELEIKAGQCVMDVAQDNGIYVKSVCKGVPSCAECRVRLVDGEHNVLPPGSEELSLIGTGHFIDRRRLSCQLKCFGDITVDMTEQIAKQQGLIGGQKKKKLAIKDDRIEDAHAIRSSDSFDDDSSTDEAATSPAPAQPQHHQHQPQQRPHGASQRPQQPPSRASAASPHGVNAPHSASGMGSQRPAQSGSGAKSANGEGAERTNKGGRRRRRGGRGGGGGSGGGGSSTRGP